jgi:hypothetical protein
MSFNVFDESPENELVLKEQQSQNKVRRRLNKTNDRFLWITFYDLFGRDLDIYGVWRIGSGSDGISIYTLREEHLLCTSSRIND